MDEPTGSRLSGPWHVDEIVDRLERELAEGHLLTIGGADPMDAVPGAVEPPD